DGRGLRAVARQPGQGVRVLPPSRAQLSLSPARHPGREAKPRQGDRCARLAHVPDASSGCRARALAATSVPQARLPGCRQPRAALVALHELTRIRREDGCMSDFEHRLKQDLEPILELPDPRERISAYHDMPYAIFR